MSDDVAKFTHFEKISIQPGTVGVWPVLPDRIQNTDDGHRIWASMTDEQRSLYRPSVADDRMAPAPRTDADLAEEIRAAIRSYIPDPACHGQAYQRELDELLAWVDRATAALDRVAGLEENGYDPITDTGAPR